MIDRWEIPFSVVEETWSDFRAKDAEVFVIWTSALGEDEERIRILRGVLPEQEAVTTGDGVYVRIEGAELSRVQFDNFDRGERSVIQLHTHPTSDVEMSPLDRKWEVVCHTGALSVIVPNYGQDGFDGLTGVNVYERMPDDWRLWPQAEVVDRIHIV